MKTQIIIRVIMVELIVILAHMTEEPVSSYHCKAY